MQFPYYKFPSKWLLCVQKSNQPPCCTVVVMWELFGDDGIFLKIIIVSYSLNRFINIVDAVTFFLPTAVDVLFPTEGINL